MKPLQHLKQLILEAGKIKYPTMREGSIPINVFTNLKNKEQKQLRRIEKFLNLIGGCSAEIRVTRGERKVEGTNKIDFYTGKVSGEKVTWTKGTGIKGESDITSVMFGRSVYIELKRVYKNGRDRQSEDQKRFQAEKEAAGALYVITSSYEDFYTRIFPVIKEEPFISKEELLTKIK